jgi:hypothetical protein
LTKAVEKGPDARNWVIPGLFAAVVVLADILRGRTTAAGKE